MLVSVEVASVLVEHVREDVLSVLKSLDHLQVSRLHGRVERVGASLTTLVNIGHNLGL